MSDEEPRDILPLSDLRTPNDAGPLLDWIERHLPHYRTKDWSTMHEKLGPRLDALHGDRGQKLNILAPRGGGKSTFATLAYVLREAVCNREPYIWIISDTSSQATSHLANLMEELLDNESLQLAYPGSVGRGPLWRAGLARLNNGVQIEAFGTGQSVRGRRNRQHRPTLIVCDDLQGDRHMESPTTRANTRRWFHGGLLKAGTKTTNVVNLATALHGEALALELCRTPGWESHVFRAIVTWPRDMAKWEQWEAILANCDNPLARQEARRFYDDNRDMDDGAEVLWPAEEDLYTLMTLRAESGHSAFEREKQNSPLDPDRCEWPAKYFGDWMWFDYWPGQFQIRTAALDPSKGSRDRQGDFSALVMMVVDEQGDMFVEAELARQPLHETVELCVARLKQFQPDVFGLEINQFQELLAPDFVDEFHRQGVFAKEPKQLDNRTSKRVRILRLSPYLAARRLHFKRDSPGTKLLVDQLRAFPIGEHDDGPDALEMAMRLADDYLGRPDDEERVAGRIAVE